MKVCSPILYSGLGNMMFKVAAAYSYCLRHDFEFKIYTSHCHDCNHSKFEPYKKTIFSKINFTNNTAPKLPVFKEPTMLYSEIPLINQSFLIMGDFQSNNYFKDFNKEVVDLLLPDQHQFDGENYCSIHVRRGDFIDKSSDYINLNLDYYREACKLLPNRTKFIVISNDQDWCMSNFTKENGFNNIEFTNPKNPDYLDFEIMSKCESNIIANSTFSWWPAYLNKNNEKRVIAPKKWITDSFARIVCQGQSTQYMKELIPSTWTLL